MAVIYQLRTSGAIAPRFPICTSNLILADLAGISRQLGKEDEGQSLDDFAEAARDCVCLSTGDKIHAFSLDQFRALLMQGAAIVQHIERRVATRPPEAADCCPE